MDKFFFLCSLLVCLTYLSVLQNTLAEVPTVFSKEGMDAHIIWTLGLPPHPNKSITVRNEEDKNLFVIFQQRIRTHPSFQDKIQVFLNQNHSIINFTIFRVSKSDAGLYYARHNAEEEPGVLLVILDNPDTPIISEITRPILYNALLLRCSSKSNSKPQTPRRDLIFKWFVEGKNITVEKRYLINQSNFSIKPLLLEDSGSIITCNAYDNHVQSKKSSPYVVEPFYAAQKIFLSPENKTYWYEVGDTAEGISCSADCSPKCALSWYFQSEEIGNDTTLSLGLMNNEKSGKYFCTATNEFGRIESDFIFMRILNLTLNIDDYHVCVYGNNTEMDCSVNNLTNYVRFLPWTHERNSTVLNQFSGILNATQNVLTIPSCRYKDDGEYICRADMSYYKTNVIKTARTKLKIIGPPILSKISKTNMLRKNTTTIAVDFYSSLQSSVRVRWYKDGTNILLHSKFQSSLNKAKPMSTNDTKSSNNARYHAVLQIVNFTVEDSGNYSCQISNDYGMFIASIMLEKNGGKTTLPVSLDTYITGGSAGAVVLLFGGVLVHYYIKRRKRHLRTKVLRRLKLRMQINNPPDSRHGSESLENDSHYLDIAEIVDSDMQGESSHALHQEMDDVIRLSDESYDDFIDVISDIQSNKTDRSSYEDLNAIKRPSSYTQLDEKKQDEDGSSKDTKEPSIKLPSDDDSNLADDENSTSNSDELDK